MTVIGATAGQGDHRQGKKMTEDDSWVSLSRRRISHYQGAGIFVKIAPEMAPRFVITPFFALL